MRTTILLTFLLSAASSAACGATWVIGPGGKNLVQFESRAPMETVSGKTRQVSGRFELDPGSLGDSITVHVEVDLASLDTGIDLRNRHMRENHLHTDEHPKAVFRGGTASKASERSLSGGKVTFTLAGQMNLHGVARRIEIPVEITGSAGGGPLHVTSRFQLKLSDYGIPRPQFLVMKLDEVQRITFDVVATPAK